MSLQPTHFVPFIFNTQNNSSTFKSSSIPLYFHVVSAITEPSIITYDKLPCPLLIQYQSVSSVISHLVTTVCTWQLSVNLRLPRLSFSVANRRQSLGGGFLWSNHNQRKLFRYDLVFYFIRDGYYVVFLLIPET